MTLREYRQTRTPPLSLEALGQVLGKSKGHLHEVEKTGRATAKLALAIERETRGLVDAASLNDEIAEARRCSDAA